MTTRQLVGAMVTAALLALAACSDDGGSDGDAAATTTTTEAAAEFDAEDGKVEVPDGDGGSFEVDGDGMTVTDGEGETRVVTGDDATVPDGWPEGLQPPAGAKLLSATTSTTPGGELLAVTAELEVPVPEALASFERQVVAAGYEVDPTGSAAGAGGVATLIASDGEEQVVASFTTTPGGTTVASISITPAR